MNTAFVTRPDYLSNKPLLWERAQSSQPESNRPPSAVSGQSGGFALSIDSKAPRVNQYFSTIPKEWHGKTLFYRGSKGWRVEGNGFVKSSDGRRAKTWDTRWNQGLTRIIPGQDPHLIRELRSITGELWEFKKRRGKFWQTDHYLDLACRFAEGEETMFSGYSLSPAD